MQIASIIDAITVQATRRAGWLGAHLPPMLREM
jgi:hypothetical protein